MTSVCEGVLDVLCGQTQHLFRNGSVSANTGAEQVTHFAGDTRRQLAA